MAAQSATRQVARRLSGGAANSCAQLEDRGLMLALESQVLAAMPKWRQRCGSDLSALHVEPIAIAFSNRVFKVGFEGEQTILKLYGSAEAAGLLVRDTELANATRLGELGLGPRVLRAFAEGRVEEFLEGGALPHDEMRRPETSSEIARTLRRMHSAGGLNHNDLHCNNIMRLADGSGLKLIDFEYAAPLDPAYDIANHFNEWMYPYLEPEPHLYDEALYPTPHEQAHFCRAYLEGGGDSGGAAGESAVAALVAEVNSRRRDSHAYWVDWAARMQPRTAFNEAYGLARRQLLERGTREAADEQLLGANSRETGVHT